MDKEGCVETFPNTPYWFLKLVEFKGERIIYKFNEHEEVIETFENMVFNVRNKKTTIGARHELADLIAQSILNHMMNSLDNECLDRVFAEFENRTLKNFDVEYLESLLKTHEKRVNIVNDGFIVDDIFIVRRDGSVYLWDNDRNKKGNYICVHPHGALHDIHLPGDKTFSAHSQTLLGLIKYLLEPHPCSVTGHGPKCTASICHIFLDQLPKAIREDYEREFKERQK